MTPSTIETQVCVVGCGIAGLYTALKLADAGLHVLLITKSRGTESNSRYAQGGIAAVLPHNPDDSLDLHVRDTLSAGAGLCDEAAVHSLLSEGYEAVADLLSFGVTFDRQADGALAVTQEAAHSVRRIIHAGGDATGASVENRLAELATAHPRIDKLEETLALDLWQADGRVAGLLAFCRQRGHMVIVRAPHVILATGGIGQLYRHTTNPAIATGDGLAMAIRAGLALQDMEFVQFHPTAFFHEGRVRFLVSEALRGEGGRLRNAQGDPFAHRYHLDGELAPRDVVTRAIFDELAISGEPCAFLDMTHREGEYLAARFPTIDRACKGFGVDMASQPIPVAPAAHYCMGGIPVDVTGRSALPGLFVIGESARTGLHGANRLASNSLLECLVLARRTAGAIIDQPQTDATFAPLPDLLPVPALAERDSTLWLTDRVTMLRDLMWAQVGVVRTTAGLRDALEQLHDWQQEARLRGLLTIAPDGWEYGNQLAVAIAITQAALARPDSIGAHFMLKDTPAPTPTEGLPC